MTSMNPPLRRSVGRKVLPAKALIGLVPQIGEHVVAVVQPVQIDTEAGTPAVVGLNVESPAL